MATKKKAVPETPRRKNRDSAVKIRGKRAVSHKKLGTVGQAISDAMHGKRGSVSFEEAMPDYYRYAARVAPEIDRIRKTQRTPLRGCLPIPTAALSAPQQRIRRINLARRRRKWLEEAYKIPATELQG